MQIAKSPICLLASVFLFVSAQPAHSVYNGTTLIQAPNVVQIIKELADGNRQGLCSGAVLSSNIVVTAAHCVTDDETGLIAKNIWVTPPGGRYKQYQEGDRNYLILEQASNVTESRAIYEKNKAISVQLTSTYYSNSSIVEDNDVAFLIIDSQLPLITPITLASDQETEDFISKKTSARIYGYGQTDFKGSTPNAPMSASMSFAFKSTNIANSAFLSSPNSSACPGDSGGPVIVSTPNRLYLVGVISGGSISEAGPGCSNLVEGNYYTLITLVTKYANLAFQSAIAAANDIKNKADEELKNLKNRTDEANAKTSNLNESLITKIDFLEKETFSLNAQIKELKTKLKLICQIKKKPKGC